MTPHRITCVCPNCRRIYPVPAMATGHHARCRMCGMVFRVEEKVPPPPTEDDILNWLREAEDLDEATAEGSHDAAGELTACSSS